MVVKIFRRFLDILLDILLHRPDYMFSVTIIPKLEALKFDDDFSDPQGPLMFKIIFYNGDHDYDIQDFRPSILIGQYNFCLNNGCIENFNDIFRHISGISTMSVITLNMLKTSMLDQLTDLLRNSEFDYFKGEYGKKLEKMLRELSSLV
jgi:hypothetical protein